MNGTVSRRSDTSFHRAFRSMTIGESQGRYRSAVREHFAIGEIPQFQNPRTPLRASTSTTAPSLRRSTRALARWKADVAGDIPRAKKQKNA